MLLLLIFGIWRAKGGLAKRSYKTLEVQTSVMDCFEIDFKMISNTYQL